jgi:predicted amidohydrolase
LPIEEQWISLLRAHAIMNNVFVVFVNRVGQEDEEYFWGGSIVVAPNGNIVKKCKKFEEEISIVEINLDEIEISRRFSSFKDHRKDFHKILYKL